MNSLSNSIALPLRTGKPVSRRDGGRYNAEAEAAFRHGGSTTCRFDKTAMSEEVESESQSSASRPRVLTFRPIMLFAVLVAACNAAAIATGTVADFTLLPSAVAGGAWWRLLTHPFVHVSWYHLVLDGSAFLFLYGALEESRRRRRVLYVVGAAVGSAAVSLLVSPAIYTNGLCGLSGIGHGLMAVTALELMHVDGGPAGTRKIGMICFLLVAAKCIMEAATGQVVLSGFHWGSVGQPIAACHAGGVLGAVACYLLARAFGPDPKGGREEWLSS